MAESRDPHEQAEELLPWYATGRLDAADRSLVEAHLAACARCQRQLAGERRMVDRFRAKTPRYPIRRVGSEPFSRAEAPMACGKAQR